MEICCAAILRILIQLVALGAVLVGHVFCVPALQLYRNVDHALGLNASTIPERVISTPLTFVERGAARNYSDPEDGTTLSSPAVSLNRRGRVVMFVPPAKTLAGWIKLAREAAQMLSHPENQPEAEYKTIREAQENSWSYWHSNEQGVSTRTQGKIHLGKYPEPARDGKSFYEIIEVPVDVSSKKWRELDLLQTKSYKVGDSKQQPTRAQFQMAYYYYETSDPNAAAQDSYGLGDLLGPRTIVTTFQGSMRSGNPLPKVWYFSDLYFMALLDAVHDHKPLPPHANPHDLEVMAPPFTTFVGLEDGQEDWTLRKVGTITGNFLLVALNWDMAASDSVKRHSNEETKFSGYGVDAIPSITSGPLSFMYDTPTFAALLGSTMSLEMAKFVTQHKKNLVHKIGPAAKADAICLLSIDVFRDLGNKPAIVYRIGARTKDYHIPDLPYANEILDIAGESSDEESPVHQPDDDPQEESSAQGAARGGGHQGDVRMGGTR